MPERARIRTFSNADCTHGWLGELLSNLLADVACWPCKALICFTYACADCCNRACTRRNAGCWLTLTGCNHARHFTDRPFTPTTTFRGISGGLLQAKVVDQTTLPQSQYSCTSVQDGPLPPASNEKAHTVVQSYGKST